MIKEEGGEDGLLGEWKKRRGNGERVDDVGEEEKREREKREVIKEDEREKGWLEEENKGREKVERMKEDK